MNRTFKKVLSFVLALAMVVLATVPAFAATGVVDPAEPNDTQIKFCVTKGGLKSGINGVVAGPDDEDVAYTNGEGVFTNGDEDYLDPSTTYVFELEEDEVAEGTPNKFSVTTNAKGQIELVKAITTEDGKVVNEVALDVKADTECQFEFKLLNEAAEEGYTVYTRLPNGARVEAPVDVQVYPVKTVNGEYAYADGSAINQVDYDAEPLGSFTVPAGSRTVDSAITFNSTSTPTLEQAQDWVTAEGLPIVALVHQGKDGEFDTDDDVVVFTNFSKDKQAVLTMNDGTLMDLKVIVQGLNNPTVAVPGATVEIQKNSTKLFGPESFGDAIATGKTNANGEVVFKDIKVSELLRYLSDDAIWDEDDYEGSFKELNLPFRAVVTAADGYAVPVGVTLTVAEVSDGEVIIQLVPTNANKLVKRIYGDNRVETSVAVARELYTPDTLGELDTLPDPFTRTVNPAEAPDEDFLVGEKNIILANGWTFADALTANGLTSYYDAPILLTNGTTIDPAVQKFIDDYDVENVIIVGGTAAISGSVETALEKQGLTTTRLFGQNRYGTAAAIAERIAAFYGGVLPRVDVDEATIDTEYQVFVASGEDFADALVASVPAAIYGTPILLTAKNSVPAPTADVIKELKVTSGIVIGGDAAISNETYGNLNIATKERLYGENRQITSMRVAERFFPQAGSAFIAGGTRYPDALVGGALSAYKEAPILLTNTASLTPAVADYLLKHKITDVTILGGSAAVSTAVETALEEVVLKASR